MISIMTTALSWVSPKRLAILAGVILAGFLSVQVVSFVGQAMDDRERVVVLEIENQSLEENLRVRQLLLTQQINATRIAEEALAAELERASEFQQAERDVFTAPEEDDAPVAPVLDNALDFLRNRSN